jgi:hypothetical protein
MNVNQVNREAQRGNFLHDLKKEYSTLNSQHEKSHHTSYLQSHIDSVASHWSSVLSDPNPNPSIADDIPIGDDAISDVSNSIKPPSSEASEQPIDNGGPAVVAPLAAPAIEAPPPFHVVPYVEHKHVHIHIPDHHDRCRLPPQGPVVEEPPDNGRSVVNEPHRLENGPE